MINHALEEKADKYKYLLIGEITSIINNARARKQTTKLSLCEIMRFEKSVLVGIIHITPNISPNTSTIVATPQAESKPAFRFKPKVINDNVNKNQNE